MKCEYCGKERLFPFVEVKTIHSDHKWNTSHLFCDFGCLDKFLHEKLHVKSKVVKL